MDFPKTNLSISNLQNSGQSGSGGGGDKKNILIAAGAAVLILGGVGVYFMFFSGGGKSEEELSGVETAMTNTTTTTVPETTAEDTTAITEGTDPSQLFGENEVLVIPPRNTVTGVTVGTLFIPSGIDNNSLEFLQTLQNSGELPVNIDGITLGKENPFKQ